jgi:hypothetical protein
VNAARGGGGGGGGWGAGVVGRDMDESDEGWHNVGLLQEGGGGKRARAEGGVGRMLLSGVAGLSDRAGGGGGESGRGGARRELLQSELDGLSVTLRVSLDAYGKELINNEEYLFRLRALNTFNHSRPSEVIAVTPVGVVPTAPANISTTCTPDDNWEVYAPVACTKGRGYSTQATLSFRKPHVR